MFARVLELRLPERLQLADVGLVELRDVRRRYPAAMEVLAGQAPDLAEFGRLDRPESGEIDCRRRGGGDGMDLMAALKSRMDQRRRGISGARKTENEGGGGGTADVQPSKWNLIKQDPSESPISMAGIASALKAAASNRKEDSGADEDWSDEN